MSDNRYTPSMDEVRDNYVVSRTRNFAEYYAGMDFPSAVDCSSAEFNRALAAHDREVAAKAWDEGFNAGFDAELVRSAIRPGAPDMRVNPYRDQIGENK